VDDLGSAGVDFDGDGVCDALIAGVQQRFPDFRFRLLGQPNGYGEQVRFCWGLGPDGADSPIKGTDFIDALALVPPVRALRILRLLRLLRLVRSFAGFYRVVMHLRGVANHRGLAWLLLAWLSVMAITSAFVYLAEHVEIVVRQRLDVVLGDLDHFA